MRRPLERTYNSLTLVHKINATNSDPFSPLQDFKNVQKSVAIARKTIQHDNKFRIVPPLVSAYRPLSGSGTTRHKKLLRLKEEPVSPVMSSYNVSGPAKQEAYYCRSLTLALVLLAFWPGKLYQCRSFIPNSNTTIHPGPSEPILLAVSAISTTAVPNRGLLRPSCGIFCVSANKQWSCVCRPMAGR